MLIAYLISSFLWYLWFFYLLAQIFNQNKIRFFLFVYPWKNTRRKSDVALKLLLLSTHFTVMNSLLCSYFLSVNKSTLSDILFIKFNWRPWSFVVVECCIRPSFDWYCCARGPLRFPLCARRSLRAEWNSTVRKRPICFEDWWSVSESEGFMELDLQIRLESPDQIDNLTSIVGLVLAVFAKVTIERFFTTKLEQFRLSGVGKTS